jgi:hypothetical protein
MISKDGALYVCGFGEYLYPKDSPHFSYEPRRIELPEPIKMSAAGQSHVLALSESGNVYAWGSGEYGQIGNGIKSSSQSPQLVLFDKKVEQISCGRYHSMAVTREGILYAWGCGENGQLGVNSDENKVFPEIVSTCLGAVVGQVSCGLHHTAVLTSAPWTKLSQEIKAYQKNYLMELKFKGDKVKDKNKSLNDKDLKVNIFNDTKAELVRLEEIDSKANEHNRQTETEEISSILSPLNLRATLQTELKAEKEDGSLPPVGERSIKDSLVAGEEDGAISGRKPGASGAATRLPAIYTDKKAKTIARRKLRSAQGEPEETEATESKGLARVAFLKETAMVLKKMTTIVQDNGDTLSKKTLQKMLKDVFTLRKECDVLRHERSCKQTEMETLAKEELLNEQASKLSGDYVSESMARKRDLEMKLNTVTIKIAETEANKKNYDDNIGYLVDEDFEKNDKLKKLRQKTGETNNLYKKVSEIRILAAEEKDKVESELTEFENEINGYQGFVNTQLERFNGVLDIVKAQNEKRRQTALKRAGKQREKINMRVLKLEDEAKSSEDQGAELNQKLSSLELKLRHYEDNFQKLTAATGLVNPDAIVNKFFFKGEIKEQLQREIEDKQQVITELKQKHIDQKAKLEELKAAFKEDRWRDVEVLSENHRGVSYVSSKNSKQIEKMTTKLAFAQEGLDNLMILLSDKLRQSVAPDPATSVNAKGMWTEEKCLHLCTNLEDISVKLSSKVAEYLEKKAQRKREIEAARAENERNIGGNNTMSIDEVHKRTKNMSAVVEEDVDVEDSEAGKDQQALPAQ